VFISVVTHFEYGLCVLLKCLSVLFHVQLCDSWKKLSIRNGICCTVSFQFYISCAGTIAYRLQGGPKK